MAEQVDGQSQCKSGEAWLKMAREAEKLTAVRKMEIDNNIGKKTYM